jgi:Na+/melibiose symporter-like transporter
MTRFGRRLLIVSVLMLILCVSPIMLYAVFGPADGNPVGLGLLMYFGGAVFTGLSVVGAVLWIVGAIKERLRSRSAQQSAAADRPPL